nr:hypothetical protein [Gloeothece verrucosa]
MKAATANSKVRNRQIKLQESLERKAINSVRVPDDCREKKIKLIASRRPTKGDRGKTKETARSEIDRATNPSQTAAIKRSPVRLKLLACKILSRAVPINKQTKISNIQIPIK